MVRSSLRFLFKSYIPVLEASSLEISKGTYKLKASMRSFHVPSSKGQEMGSLAREKTFSSCSTTAKHHWKKNSGQDQLMAAESNKT